MGGLSRISSWYRGGLYASLKGGSRCLEITRNQNGRGEFVEIVVSMTTIRGRILIPASEYGTGWKDFARALAGFVTRGGEKAFRKGDGRLNDTPQETINIKASAKVFYLQAASSGSWPSMSYEVQSTGWGAQETVEVMPALCTVIPFLRDQCLVGTLVEWTGDVRRAKELERWCKANWGIGSQVDVKDMNGPMYLFTLPTRAEARRIPNRRWKFERARMELTTWEDSCGCFVDIN